MITLLFLCRKKTSFVPTKNVFTHPNHAQYITETTPPQSCFFCYKNILSSLLKICNTNFLLWYTIITFCMQKQHNIFLKFIPYFSFIILLFYLSDCVYPLNGTDRISSWLPSPLFIFPTYADRNFFFHTLRKKLMIDILRHMAIDQTIFDQVSKIFAIISYL